MALLLLLVIAPLLALAALIVIQRSRVRHLLQQIETLHGQNRILRSLISSLQAVIHKFGGSAARNIPTYPGSDPAETIRDEYFLDRNPYLPVPRSAVLPSIFVGLFLLVMGSLQLSLLQNATEQREIANAATERATAAARDQAEESARLRSEMDALREQLRRQQPDRPEQRFPPNEPPPGQDPKLLQQQIESADVLAHLTWNNDADLDLSVDTPTGETISYEGRTSRDGGQLDRDVTTGRGPENIFWTSKHASRGTYHVYVTLYHGHPANYRVEVLSNGRRSEFSGTVAVPGERIHVTDLVVR